MELYEIDGDNTTHIQFYGGVNNNSDTDSVGIRNAVGTSISHIFTQITIVNDNNIKRTYDLPKVVMNYGGGAAKYKEERLGFNNDAADLDYDAVIGDIDDPTSIIAKYFTDTANTAIKNRYEFNTFNELGVNFSLLGNPADEYAVFTGSIPYRTMAYEDPRLVGRTIKATLFGENDYGATFVEGNYPQAIIDALKNGNLTAALAQQNGVDFGEFSRAGTPLSATVAQESERRPIKFTLNAQTPEWLITALVGWQMFNSPTAEKRMAAQAHSQYEGGAIYRIDYASITGGAYVFDQRLLYENSGGTFSPELIITPYGYTAPDMTQIVTAGNGNYHSFPLKYDGVITCLEGPVNAVGWSGWRDTTNLDLLAFAPNTSNSYVANGASPFSVNYIDPRTGTFAGTGTYVRPSVSADYNADNPDNPFYAGRLGIYGNTLRAHGELARIVEIINEHKGDADPIAAIIAAIYADPQVGYEIGAPVSRTVLARNPFEGTTIWARNPSGAGDYQPVLWTTNSAPEWDKVMRNKVDGADVDNPARSEIHAPSFALLTSGSGFTADRYIETFMDSGITYVSNSQSGGHCDNGGECTSGDWRDFVVDNVALDWDGSPMNLIGGANFGFYNTISYARESAFQDSYFQKGLPYASAHPYDLWRGVSDGTGSNVQGYDSESAGGNTTSAIGFAEPVWYSTGNAMAPDYALRASWFGSTWSYSLSFSNNYRSGPVIYCDAGGASAGNYSSRAPADVRTLTAPPYQTGTGRWDDRGSNTASGHDAPGYTTIDTVFGYGSASPYKTDPSKNGTLYRNDATKKISQWRWNWGRWVQIPAGPEKGGEDLKTFVFDGNQPGKRMIMTPEVADCDDATTDCVTVGAPIYGNHLWGEKAYHYLKVTDAGDLVFIGPLALPTNKDSVLNDAPLAYADADGVWQPTTLNKAALAYAGRFVMRRSHIHRWQPAIGSVYPMYLEVNPQAIKNAAIERVVLNLFGAHPLDRNGEVIPVKLNYLVPGGSVNAASLAVLRENGDLAQPVFFSGQTDNFYRVIVMAGLINTAKQTVVGKKFLQFIYRKNRPNPDGSPSGGAVVDNHYFDPE
ncbi:MAG: hypothetical protein LBP75_11185 [Planctomycetota bacterium]|jgi:hypothetical protein|nr:hypothetical protein [Planctomycetota bacterium]